MTLPPDSPEFDHPSVNRWADPGGRGV